MAKISAPMSKTIFLGEKELNFPQRVANRIDLEDRSIIRLYVDDHDHGDPMVGRNILCFDLKGEMLWRVEDAEMVIGEKDTPQSFLGLYIEDDGSISTHNPEASFNINPEDGSLYDGELKGRF